MYDMGPLNCLSMVSQMLCQDLSAILIERKRSGRGSEGLREGWTAWIFQGKPTLLYFLVWAQNTHFNGSPQISLLSHMLTEGVSIPRLFLTEQRVLKSPSMDLESYYPAVLSLRLSALSMKMHYTTVHYLQQWANLNFDRSHLFKNKK